MRIRRLLTGAVCNLWRRVGRTSGRRWRRGGRWHEILRRSEYCGWVVEANGCELEAHNQRFAKICA